MSRHLAQAQTPFNEVMSPLVSSASVLVITLISYAGLVAVEHGKMNSPRHL
jgi:hypothetical protein